MDEKNRRKKNRKKGQRVLAVGMALLLATGSLNFPGTLNVYAENSSEAVTEGSTETGVELLTEQKQTEGQTEPQSETTGETGPQETTPEKETGEDVLIDESTESGAGEDILIEETESQTDSESQTESESDADIITETESETEEPPVLKVEESDGEQTTVYIDYGVVQLTDTGAYYAEEKGGEVSGHDLDPDGYTIRQENTAEATASEITVSAGIHSLTLDGVNMTAAVPFLIEPGAAVKMTLQEDNVLTATGAWSRQSDTQEIKPYAAAINVPKDAALLILSNSTGTLKATGSTYTGEEGTLDGAAIGTGVTENGAWDMTSGAITLSGGYIEAAGAKDAPAVSAAQENCTVDGGYYAEGSIEDRTVYGIEVAEGCTVTEESQKEQTWYHVAYEEIQMEMETEAFALYALESPVAEAKSVTENTLKVSGGTNGTDYAVENNVLVIKSGAQLTISGSTSSQVVKIPYGVSANLILDNVTISARDDSVKSAFTVEGNATITLKGKNELSSGPYQAGLNVKSSGTLTLQCEHQEESGHSCSESCGTLTARAGNWAAGIGGGYEQTAGKITINSGVIYAIGSGSGACIGGGHSNSTRNGGATVVINGGIVDATGRINNHTGGAGIGGGYLANVAASVTITGGVVKATGATNAAGIGSGNVGATSTIKITGGTVTAKGGYQGAGIGGGYLGAGSNISISGGFIKADQGGNAMDIGSSSGGSTSTVSLTGGYYEKGETGKVYGYTVPNYIQVLQKTVEGKVWYYLNLDENYKGGFNIVGLEEKAVEDTDYSYDMEASTLYIKSSKKMMITMASGYTQTDNQIAVEENVKAYVTLSGVSVNITQTNWRNDSSAMYLKQNSSCVLTLAEDTRNELITAEGAGIKVPEKTNLIIDGNGALYAKGNDSNSYSGCAGIGAYRRSYCGDIQINSGIIDTEGDFAGIGGTDYIPTGAKVTINGGIINARGGSCGIGGLSFPNNFVIKTEIYINGGIINAKGGSVAIGAYAENDNVILDIKITGGYVNCLSGSIGSSYNNSTTKVNIAITGGYFADTAYTAGKQGTVYGNQVASDCYVEQMTSQEGYTCRVFTPTAEASYDIYDAVDLANFAKNVNEYGFASINANLMADIDMSSVTAWTPIGTSTYKYSGTFEGNGHTVSNLKCSFGAVDVAGLFGYNTGTIRNLGIIDSSMQSYMGTSYMGAVAGRNAGTIKNCYNTGTVSSPGDTGGIVGWNETASSVIEDCYNTGTVSGMKMVGGIAGQNIGSIKMSYNTGNLSDSGGAEAVLGGIAGSSSKTVEYCYNQGKVTNGAGTVSGGIVGKNTGSVMQCYDSGAVSCTVDSELVGSIVGDNQSGTSVTACYGMENAAGALIGTGKAATGSAVKSEAEFRSGSVAWLLQGSVAGESKTLIWGQRLLAGNREAYPRFGGLRVYSYAGRYVNDKATLPKDAKGVYLIYTADQLTLFRDLVNNEAGYKTASARLMSDIDLNPAITFNRDGTYSGGNPEKWNPISNSYTGTFDGNGNVVSGIYMTTGSNIGLFGTVGSGCVIKELGIENSYIAGSGTVGSLVGSSQAVIQKCYSSATVKGSSKVGGLTGSQNGGSITSCYFTGTVTASANEAGGIVGSNQSAIKNCYCSGTVTGGNGAAGVGGIAGTSSSSTAKVEDCYSSDVTAKAIGTSSDGATDTNVSVSAASQFPSGKITWMLNGEQLDGIWKQTFPYDASPNFTGSTVYRWSEEDYRNEAPKYDAPDTPTATVIGNSITIDKQTAPAGTTTQYACKEGTAAPEDADWTTSNKFIDLNAGTAYTCYVRFAENGSSYTSAVVSQMFITNIGNVSYMDATVAANGQVTMSKKTADDCMVLTDNTQVVTLGTADTTTWYTVTKSVTLGKRITIAGDVRLILVDDTTLTATEGITVESGNSLAIYGQEQGTGKLSAGVTSWRAAIGGAHGTTVGTITINGGMVTADATDSYLVQNNGLKGAAAGIGSGYKNDTDQNDSRKNEGTIIINGGEVTATGGLGSAGIGGGYGVSGGTTVIHGGDVTATGGQYGAGIGSGWDGNYNAKNNETITITGGTITATPGDLAAGIGGGFNSVGGKITITGGNVTAGNGTYSPCIGGGQKKAGGDITISGGIVKVSKGANCEVTIGEGASGTGSTFSTGTKGTTIILNDGLISDTSGRENWKGLIFESGSGTVYSDVTLNTDLTLDAEKTLTVLQGTTLTIPQGITVTNNGTIEDKGTIQNGGVIVNNSTVNVYGALNGNAVTVNPAIFFTKCQYQDYNPKTGEFSTKERDNCIVLLHQTELTSGWYVVNSEVTFSTETRLTVTGNVHLILADGGKLTVPGGITVNNQPDSLTIYGQSLGTGTLIAGEATTKWRSGIGGGDGQGGGNITINGGKVTAIGGQNGAGIGSGYMHNNFSTTTAVITINGGEVTASVRSEPNPTPPNVTYFDIEAAGIGGGNRGSSGIITINGGTVTATGGRRAAAIGSGRYGTVDTITINGGTITANTSGGGGVSIGRGNTENAPTGGTIFISKKATITLNDLAKESNLWNKIETLSGVVYTDKIGIFNGSALIGDLTVPKDYTLTVPEGSELAIPSGMTLTNNGTITNSGTINKVGNLTNNGTISYPVTLAEGDAEITSFQTSTDGKNFTASDLSFMVNYGTDLYVKAIFTKGHVIKQWNDGSIEPVYHISKENINPVSLTAVSDFASYKIEYKDIGGTDFTGSFGSTTKPIKHTYGTPTTLVNPTRDGYIFDGWFITPDCMGTAIETLAADGYIEDITLYAKWTPVTYTITIPSNVTAGGNAVSITASDLKLGTGGEVHVKANSGDGYDISNEGIITLKRKDATDDTITSQMYLGENEFKDLTQDVAVFTEGSNVPASVKFGAPSHEGTIPAGDYSGTVTFQFTYEEQQ